MSHRSWISAHLLLAAIAACGRPEERAREPAGSGAPRWDVLFLAVDDLRDWVGCMGTDSGASTPNIDRLAARGVIFRRAYCPAPLCNPSRAALITGVPPHVSGVYSNAQDWRPRLSEAIALPSYFRQHGYRALGAGKLIHDAYNDEGIWDEYFQGGKSAKPPFASLPLNGLDLTNHFDWGPLERGPGALRDWHVAEWAREALAKEHELPLFLGVGFRRPHLPWYVPQEHFARHPLDGIRLPVVKEGDLEDVSDAARALATPDDHETITSAGQWGAAIQGYLASIDFADRCIGRVLDALDASPRRDRTIVVLWSDHGWHLGEKSHWRKSTLWEEGTRVPLVIVAPGLAPAGAVCDRPVSLMDLYPTLVELCALPPRDGIAGTSLVPLLADPSLEWDRRALTTHGANNHSLRAGDWRYTRYADGSEELYDHSTDPHEWTNLASREESAPVLASMRLLLPSTNAPDTGPDPKTPGAESPDDEGD